MYTLRPIPHSNPRTNRYGASIRGRLLLAILLLLLLGQADAGEVASPAPEAVLQAAAKRAEAGDFSGAADALLGLDADPLSAGLQRQADLLLGILLAHQGRCEEAIPRLHQLTGKLAAGPLDEHALPLLIREAAQGLGGEVAPPQPPLRLG